MQSSREWQGWGKKSVFKGAMQRNRGKQQNGKDQRSFQENWRYQGNISWKHEHNKGQKGKELTEAEDIKKQ